MERMEKEGFYIDLEKAVAEVESKLANTSHITAYPVLVMLSGLPGTGKSYLARKLSERVPFVIVESDFVRKTLFNPPSYSSRESALVHKVCHILIDRLLKKGLRVIFDATNLSEVHREYVYRLAERNNAKLVIIQTVAPEEVVRERLEKRHTARDNHDISDADWSVYSRMKEYQQPISRPHIVVDTSRDLEEEIQRILRVLQR
ncbi:MAG: ATP-binding protein [Anaerolineae bacterium]|nr:ATP-binding protein [Anaerolineae bacterium]MDW8102669.1 ATP-binding protein [Anaerolineae bacterium]